MAIMNMTEIITKHQQLEKRLMQALATMERKDTIKELRLQLMDLQAQCPHTSEEYNFAWVDDTCPYCGKQNAR